jgi:hypothetical protein
VLYEALGDCALPYDSIARQVQAFTSGRVSPAYVHCIGHFDPVHMDIIEQYMEEDRCLTVK